MHPSSLKDHLRELLEPTLGRLGYDLVAIEMVAGRRRTLRLSIDKPGGVVASDCVAASVKVSPLLDEDDPIQGAYDLEVSSPGIDRPVQRWEDFRRFVGYRIRIRLEEGLPRRRFTGRLVAAAEGRVHVEADGEVHELEFESIEAAHLALDLDEYAKLADGVPLLPEESLATEATDAGPTGEDGEMENP